MECNRWHIQPINATIVNNRTRLTIKLEAWESKLISIGKNNREYNIKEYGVKGNGYSETALYNVSLMKQLTMEAER